MASLSKALGTHQASQHFIAAFPVERVHKHPLSDHVLRRPVLLLQLLANRWPVISDQLVTLSGAGNSSLDELNEFFAARHSRRNAGPGGPPCRI